MDSEGVPSGDENRHASWSQSTHSISDYMMEGLYTVDAHGRVMYMNPASQALLGWTSEELVGRNMHDATHYKHPDGSPFPASNCPKFNLLSNPAPLSHHPDTFIHKDGTFIPVVLSAVPIFNKGSVAGAIVVFRDDTTRRATAQALRDSEERLRLLILHAPTAIALFDSNMRYVLASKRWIQCYGLQENLTGHSHYEFFPEMADHWSTVYYRILAGETTQALEERFVRADGTMQWMKLEVHPWVTSEGRAPGLLIFGEDMTAWKRAEERLRRSLLEYQSTFENAAVGMSHVSLDGRWLKVNERLCQITGYTREELLSKTFEDVTHPEDIGPDWANARRLMAGDISAYAMEKRYIRKDGSQRWINLTVSLLRNETGTIQNFISIIEDITARKETQEALHESEARFRTLADNMSQFAWMADSTGWISWYNQRWYEYTGTTFDEMQGWGWKKVHHPEHVNRVENKWRKAHETGEPWEDTFPLRGRDGTYRWFLSRALPIRDSGGRIEGWFGTNTDITCLREIQASLSESEQRLQTLTADLERRIEDRTQELQESRDSLRVMTTELNLVEQRERKRLAGELHDYLAQSLVVCRLNLGRVRKEGLSPRADEVIGETEEILHKALDYSRTLMAELSPPVLQHFGLVAGIKWLAEQFQHYGLHVTVEEEELVGSVLSDDTAVLLYQSVRELLLNILKHAKTENAHIRIYKGVGDLRIEVADSGVGFAMASLRAMNKDHTPSRFGLFSLRERMNTIGGQFDLQSSPGGGTKALLILPVTIRERTPGIGDGFEYERALPPPSSSVEPALPHPAAILHSQKGRIRVLLVDDHAMVRQGLRSLLDSYPDLEVIGEACNGEEAVAMTRQLHPALVVMDINMPKMNGIEATAHIKARYPGTIVIGLSVNAGAVNREAMLKAGAVLLLTKEAAARELYDAIVNSIPPHGT
ncbi:MAG: PAS domain S-box protein [Nitrospira sp.]|nr:PAS domain S-box protein [Nitrospira sp.]